jgi:hypothetical protein
MKPFPFQELSVIGYLAKNNDLTLDERKALRDGLGNRAKKLVDSLKKPKAK